MGAAGLPAGGRSRGAGQKVLLNFLSAYALSDSYPPASANAGCIRHPHDAPRRLCYATLCSFVRKYSLCQFLSLSHLCDFLQTSPNQLEKNISFFLLTITSFS